jgi:colicin import membrane protein
MEVKIIKEKQNSLFNRKEILAEIELSVAPSRDEVLKILSNKFSVSEENIKLLGINGSFGSNKFNLKANIYTSKKEKDSIEIKKKKEIEAEKKILEAKKKQEEEKKALEDAKKAEAEKPVEEVKEESIEETKSEEKVE